MECNGKCRNIGIVENNTDGDVDLYGREDAIPDLDNDIENFDSHCVSCKCRSHKSDNDQCSILQTSGNKFFFTVHVYSVYSTLTVIVTCDNLSNVKCIGDQCGRDTGTFSK